MPTEAEKTAMEEAQAATVTGLIFGACTHRHGKVFLNEFIRWVKAEMGEFTTQTVDRILREEYGALDVAIPAGKYIQIWEAAKLISSSQWLKDGASGIRHYRPRSFKRWIENIIRTKSKAVDMTDGSKALIGACLDHAGIDVLVAGLDD